VGIAHLNNSPTQYYNTVMVSKIIKSEKFKQVASNVKPDAKKRVMISRAVAEPGVTYHIYANEIGQIILDPQVSIPASEVWLYRDKEAKESVDKGLKEAAAGKIKKIDLKSL
jgi:hypothetical protein